MWYFQRRKEVARRLICVYIFMKNPSIVWHIHNECLSTVIVFFLRTTDAGEHFVPYKVHQMETETLYYTGLFYKKIVVWIICNTNFLAHTNPLFFKTKNLEIFDLHTLKLAVYMFNNRNNEFTIASYDYKTRFGYFLVPQYLRLYSAQRSLDFSGLSLWNSLPEDMRILHSLILFENRVKKYWIDQYSA